MQGAAAAMEKMSMSTPEEHLEFLKGEHQRLEQYLRALSPDAWDHPSACARWTLADVIAHMTGIESGPRCSCVLYTGG